MKCNDTSDFNIEQAKFIHFVDVSTFKWSFFENNIF